MNSQLSQLQKGFNNLGLSQKSLDARISAIENTPPPSHLVYLLTGDCNFDDVRGCISIPISFVI